MIIYFFTKPNNYDLIFKVGITDDKGRRHICGLWEQDGKHYVHTGNIIKGECKRYDFSEDQEAELIDFMNSSDSNREYFDNPLK